MSWGAQNRSKDAKTPSVAGVWSKNPELDCCPVQPYPPGVAAWAGARSSHRLARRGHTKAQVAHCCSCIQLMPLCTRLGCQLNQMAAASDAVRRRSAAVRRRPATARGRRSKRNSGNGSTQTPGGIGRASGWHLEVHIGWCGCVRFFSFGGVQGRGQRGLCI
jgi:hypothetical protein